MSLVWILAGLVGGAVAGVVDAGVAVAGGIGGMSVGKALRLALLAAGLLAVAGGVAGALVAAGGALASRTRNPQRWAALGWAVAAAPLVAYDAFALFAGTQAAKVPGHHFISVGLIALGTAAVAGASGLYQAAARAGGRWRGGAIAALALTAVAAETANRWVLPRLYGWFHTTLAALALALFVAAARLELRPPRPSRLALAAAAAVAACAGAILQVRSSQVMRYQAHERTAMASVALRAVPASLRAPSVAPAARRSTEAALPPLPDGPRRPQADVLLITVDALRADHVGAYGYPRATTPAIDALARGPGGVRFTRAYAQAPHTSFSVASMLTAKYFPTVTRVAPGQHHEPIAAVLRHFGWRTAAFYPPAVFYIDGHKLKRYADSNFDFEYVKFEFIDAQKRVDQVLAYYAEANPQRSFVWIHFFEPHEPYQSHAGYAFGGGDVDRYDSEIAYTDAAVGRLVAEARKRRPGTIVILTADHGEEFDEHGGRYHGTTLYDEQLRVPLIVSVPGVPAHVVDGQVELVDLVPTILTLLDIPVPARMRGSDLGPWLAGGPTPAPASRLPPAFAELEDKRMIVSGTDKLLCDLKWGTCAYYDLAADPREQRNLAEDRADRAAALRAELNEWLDGHVRFEPLAASGGSSDPAAGGADDPAPRAIERGRLGDARAAPELAALLSGADASLAQRREAAALLVALPAQPATAAALARAASDVDRVIADWAAVGAARLGDATARPRAEAIVADTAADPSLRVHAALALAARGDARGVPALGGALDHCEDVLLCRTIITALGKLRDRQAVPVLIKHLPEVQNRREMVEALGEIGDPAAADALLERLRTDEYVPVRVAAAAALAQLGDARVAPALEAAARQEKEATVIAAARAAVASLRGKRSQTPSQTPSPTPSPTPR
jgi:arylsulfatase A-like enzyme